MTAVADGTRRDDRAPTIDRSTAQSLEDRRDDIGWIIARLRPGTRRRRAIVWAVGRLPAEGFGAHVPKGYIYAAMAFAAFIEALNIAARKARLKRKADSP